VRSRSALLVRSDSFLQLETLGGTTAAWVDRLSLAGHLLPMAWLRERGLEPGKLFGQQLFLGSYQPAWRRSSGARRTSPRSLRRRRAMTCASGGGGRSRACGRRAAVLACTMPALHDAWLVAPHVSLQEALRLERGLCSVRELPEGTALLRDVLRAERLERAPAGAPGTLYARVTEVTLPLRAEASA
jgi:hypothetical protein